VILFFSLCGFKQCALRFLTLVSTSTVVVSNTLTSSSNFVLQSWISSSFPPASNRNSNELTLMSWTSSTFFAMLFHNLSIAAKFPFSIAETRLHVNCLAELFTFLLSSQSDCWVVWKVPLLSGTGIRQISHRFMSLSSLQIPSVLYIFFSLLSNHKTIFLHSFAIKGSMFNRDCLSLDNDNGKTWNLELGLTLGDIK